MTFLLGIGTAIIPFMKKDKGVYDKVCEYIRPHLKQPMQ